MVRNPPSNSGNTRDAGSIFGSGRSAGEEMATHSSIIAWEISWTEEPRGQQSMGSQKSQTRLSDWTYTHKGELFFSFKKKNNWTFISVLHLISETRTSRIMLKIKIRKGVFIFPKFY